MFTAIARSDMSAAIDRRHGVGRRHQERACDCVPCGRRWAAQVEERAGAARSCGSVYSSTAVGAEPAPTSAYGGCTTRLRATRRAVFERYVIQKSCGFVHVTANRPSPAKSRHMPRDSVQRPLGGDRIYRAVEPAVFARRAATSSRKPAV